MLRRLLRLRSTAGVTSRSGSTSSTSISGGDTPPEGSRAAAFLKTALAMGGGPDAAALRASLSSGTISSTDSPITTAPESLMPFAPRAVTYDGRVTTPRADPVSHTFSDAGLYFSLAEDAAGAAAAFSSGFPGALATEFACTKSHALLVRPVGVALVAHLEHWRQTYGRKLSTGGFPVLDIDAKTPYVPRKLEEVPSRAAAAANVAGGGGEGVGGASANIMPDPSFLGGFASPLTTKFRPVRLLTGPRGTGKSGVLAYAVHYARKAGWLTILVPDCFSVATMGLVLAPSRARPGSYDQHDVALSVLRDVAANHGPALRKLPQRGKYAAYRYLPSARDAVVSAEREALRASEEAEVARQKAMAEAAGKAWDAATFRSAYEEAEKETGLDRSKFTLSDLVEWGLRHPAALTDTLLALLAELRSVTEFPVLIAVDGINHLYTQGPYAMDGELLPPEKLSVQAAFRPFDEFGFKESMQMKRGIWLTAVSHTHSADMKPMFTSASVRDRYRVPVPRLTRQEIYSTLKHYAASGNFFMLQENPKIEAFDVEYYRTLSGGIPEQVFQTAMFVPALAKKKEKFVFKKA